MKLELNEHLRMATLPRNIKSEYFRKGKWTELSREWASKVGCINLLLI